jgi:putative addiction module component (TIGR02574 family)
MSATIASMVSSALLAEAIALAPEERLELISTLWDSLDEPSVPPADDELAIATARLKEFRDHPTDVVPVEQVFAEARALIE